MDTQETLLPPFTPVSDSSPPPNTEEMQEKEDKPCCEKCLEGFCNCFGHTMECCFPCAVLCCLLGQGN